MPCLHAHGGAVDAPAVAVESATPGELFAYTIDTNELYRIIVFSNGTVRAIPIDAPTPAVPTGAGFCSTSSSDGASMPAEGLRDVYLPITSAGSVVREPHGSRRNRPLPKYLGWHNAGNAAISRHAALATWIMVADVWRGR